ncbi:MAG: SUMF1/EgtB/PvdO family nonheme iron enzyme [Anaerolineales bacterium]|jgi:formylglycine-generating enzyme required for sulfatase activity
MKKAFQVTTVVEEVTAAPIRITPTASVDQPAPTSIFLEVLLPEMVRVEPGEFLMGSDEGLPKETPLHKVTITRPFSIGQYPVTNKEFSQLCQVTKKCSFPDDSLPVIGVDWYQAVEYCNWISECAGLTPCYSGKGKFTKCDFSTDGFRLPTEAEWEFAARGGNVSKGFLYAGSDEPDDVAWYAENSEGKPHPVGEKLSNELGIYDMSGNAWEWCWDWFDEGYYDGSPEMDPQGPENPPGGPMPSKSRRSGSYLEDAHYIRVTFRSSDDVSYAGGNGFRVVQTLQ